jgi:hypothetical protein
MKAKRVGDVAQAAHEALSSNPRTEKKLPTRKRKETRLIYIYIYLYIYEMEFYSATRKNDTMGFEDKWIQLEDTVLSEVCQVQNDKAHMFSHIPGRQT